MQPTQEPDRKRKPKRNRSQFEKNGTPGHNKRQTKRKRQSQEDSKDLKTTTKKEKPRQEYGRRAQDDRSTHKKANNATKAAERHEKAVQGTQGGTGNPSAMRNDRKRESRKGCRDRKWDAIKSAYGRKS